MTKILLAANTDWYLFNFRLSLARFLRETGFEVVLISPPGKYAPALAESGFRWLPWGVGRQSLDPTKELASFVQLARLYRQERPDLVHHHTIKPVLYGSLAAQAVGVPAVVNSITGRGYVFLDPGVKARLVRGLAGALYRLAFRPARCAAIFENAADQRFFIDQGFVPASRTWLIPGVGVDPERFQPTPEPDGPPVVLLAGRLLWDKGVGVLVEAARRLRGDYAARFVLAGEPDPGNPASIGTDILQRWVQEGVVEWWGWQPDMARVYAQSHIVALPSRGEGLPTGLIEAAASGRPLVAADTPGCRDIVHDGVNGLLAPPDDPTALAAALARLIADPALRGRMGAAGRQMVLKKYTVSLVNTATLDVYRQVARNLRLPQAESTQH